MTRQLRSSDEILLKAVHTGDRLAWQRLAASDFFYLDEEGGVTYLEAFLHDLKPMSTKPLRICTYKMMRAADTAIVMHEDADEKNVKYIFTETWQQLGGQWKLRALHITNVLSDPPSIQLSRSQIEQLVGVYSSGSATYSIRREGTRIFAKLRDLPEVEQKAETRDVLFVPGDPRTRKVFLRDATGAVVAFVVRYESSDTIYQKER